MAAGLQTYNKKRKKKVPEMNIMLKNTFVSCFSQIILNLKTEYLINKKALMFLEGFFLLLAFYIPQFSPSASYFRFRSKMNNIISVE
jgi:hypothetical protein